MGGHLGDIEDAVPGLLREGGRLGVVGAVQELGGHAIRVQQRVHGAAVVRARAQLLRRVVMLPLCVLLPHLHVTQSSQSSPSLL